MPVTRVEVVGRVQGVGFRWFVREEARRHAIAGWVRNLPTGAVEIAAEGPQEALDQFLAAVRRGPSGAWVETVRELPVTELRALPNPFQIAR
jgi:acylphosphatase